MYPSIVAVAQGYDLYTNIHVREISQFTQSANAKASHYRLAVHLQPCGHTSGCSVADVI